MIRKLQNFKYALLASVMIYFIFFLFSAIILLILNIDLGTPNFDRDLGSWFDIFKHNIQVQFFLVVGGGTAGILTIFLLLTNGLYSGFVVGQAIVGEFYFDLFRHVALHGFFENIAFFISGGLGIQLAAILIINKFSKTTLNFFNKSLLYKLSIVVICTFLAALFEA